MDVGELRRRVAEKEREIRERESELSRLKSDLLRAEKAGLVDLKSSQPENAWQFKIKVQFGNRLRAVSVDIRATFDEFLNTVCDAASIPITSVHFGPGASRPATSSPSRITRGGIKEGGGGDGEGDRHTIHYIDSEGDVVGITSSECYEAARDQYLQSGNWNKIKPMRIVVLEGTEDPLSIVSIPPNKTSSEPVPWKQGKLLGKGAFGAVYMAMTGHGELIAVKRIDLAAAGKELTESFQVESDLLQRLDHPNIVRFVASKVISKTLAVIWMEYVPGGSVANIVQAFGAMSEDIVRSFTLQILHGLVYLHTHDVIHRDLKPGNILVSIEGVVKLSDFGASLNVSASVSRIRGSGQAAMKQNALAGTPNYIAPEVLTSKDVNGYSFNIDVWSLGMTVIEMLTAEMPFSDFSNPFAVMFQIARIKEMPVPEYLSSEATEFIRKCLRVDPAERPSAKVLVNDAFVKTAADSPDSGMSSMRSSRLKQRSSAVRNSTALKEDLWEDAVEGSAASIMSAMAASVQQRGSVCREFPQQDEDRDMEYAKKVQASLDEERRISSVLRSESEQGRTGASLYRAGSSHGGGASDGDSVLGSVIGDERLRDVLDDDDILKHVIAESSLQKSAQDAPSTIREPSDEAVAQIVDMGFSVDDSRRALAMYDDDVERATDYLLSGGSIDMASPARARTTTAQRELVLSPAMPPKARELSQTESQTLDRTAAAAAAAAAASPVHGSSSPPVPAPAARNRTASPPGSAGQAAAAAAAPGGVVSSLPPMKRVDSSESSSSAKGASPSSSGKSPNGASFQGVLAPTPTSRMGRQDQVIDGLQATRRNVDPSAELHGCPMPTSTMSRSAAVSSQNNSSPAPLPAASQAKMHNLNAPPPTRSLPAPPPVGAKVDSGAGGGGGMEWRYYHHHHWRAYDEPTRRSLEEAFSASKTDVTLQVATDSRAGTTYKFDLGRMTQTNTASGFVRKLRRETAGFFHKIEARNASLCWSSSDILQQQLDSKVLPTSSVEVRSFLLQKTQFEEQEAMSLTQQFSKSYRAPDAERAKKLKERASTLQKTLAMHDGMQQAEIQSVHSELEQVMSELREAESLESVLVVPSSSTTATSPEKRTMHAAAMEQMRLRIQHLSASGSRDTSSGIPTTAAAGGGGGGGGEGGGTQNLVYPERPLSSVEGLGERLELVPAGTAQGRHALLHLHIGNDYSGPATVVPGKGRESMSFIGGGGGESDVQQAVIHSWTLFVRARDDTSLSRWVKSVSFELKAFKAGQSSVELPAEPFQVTRKSHLSFSVPITVRLRNHQEFHLRHFLCLCISGGWSDEKPSTADDIFPYTHYVLCSADGPGEWDAASSSSSPVEDLGALGGPPAGAIASSPQSSGDNTRSRDSGGGWDSGAFSNQSESTGGSIRC